MNWSKGQCNVAAEVPNKWWALPPTLPVPLQTKNQMVVESLLALLKLELRTSWQTQHVANGNAETQIYSFTLFSKGLIACLTTLSPMQM